MRTPGIEQHCIHSLPDSLQ